MFGNASCCQSVCINVFIDTNITKKTNKYFVHLMPVVLQVFKELLQTSLQMTEASYSSSWRCKRTNPTMCLVSTLICSFEQKGTVMVLSSLAHISLWVCIVEFNSAAGRHNKQLWSCSFDSCKRLIKRLKAVNNKSLTAVQFVGGRGF